MTKKVFSITSALFSGVVANAQNLSVDNMGICLLVFGCIVIAISLIIATVAMLFGFMPKTKN